MYINVYMYIYVTLCVCDSLYVELYKTSDKHTNDD